LPVSIFCLFKLSGCRGRIPHLTHLDPNLSFILIQFSFITAFVLFYQPSLVRPCVDSHDPRPRVIFLGSQRSAGHVFGSHHPTRFVGHVLDAIRSAGHVLESHLILRSRFRIPPDFRVTFLRSASHVFGFARSAPRVIFMGSHRSAAHGSRIVTLRIPFDPRATYFDPTRSATAGHVL
jgi:hypothetical protein